MENPVYEYAFGEISLSTTIFHNFHTMMKKFGASLLESIVWIVFFFFVMINKLLMISWTNYSESRSAINE